MRPRRALPKVLAHLLSVDEPLEPGGRVRLGGGAVEDEAVPDPVVAQAAADHRASVKQL